MLPKATDGLGARRPAGVQDPEKPTPEKKKPRKSSGGDGIGPGTRSRVLHRRYVPADAARLIMPLTRNATEKGDPGQGAPSPPLFPSPMTPSPVPQCRPSVKWPVPSQIPPESASCPPAVNMCPGPPMILVTRCAGLLMPCFVPWILPKPPLRPSPSPTSPDPLRASTFSTPTQSLPGPRHRTGRKRLVPSVFATATQTKICGSGLLTRAGNCSGTTGTD